MTLDIGGDLINLSVCVLVDFVGKAVFRQFDCVKRTLNQHNSIPKIHIALLIVVQDEFW